MSLLDIHHLRLDGHGRLLADDLDIEMLEEDSRREAATVEGEEVIRHQDGVGTRLRPKETVVYQLFCRGKDLEIK